MLIDFHSHILPGIDDGSRSIEESLQILDVMADDGVGIVVATPHFYPDDISISHFIRRRNNAYEQLAPHLKVNHPKILLGAEVLYSPELIHNNDVKDLCIEGTDYLLLEMPYTKLTNAIVDSVEEFYDNSGLDIIIAHIERYLHFTSYDELENLMSLDVLGQLNAKSFEKRKTRKNCLKLINDGYVHVLGTDFHRIDREDLPVSYAYKTIAKKLSSEVADQIMHNSKLVINNTYADEILS